MILFNGNVERETNDPDKIAELRAMGYRAVITDDCYEQDDEIDETPFEEERPLETLSVKELRRLAKAKGIKGVASLNKSNLIDILQG